CECALNRMSEVPQSALPGVSRWSVTRLLHAHVSEVWIRFLLAIAGLVLAFAAALFSTVSRESGDMWTTFILASAALLLPTIVGLTTLPYLAPPLPITRLPHV